MADRDPRDVSSGESAPSGQDLDESALPLGGFAELSSPATGPSVRSSDRCFAPGDLLANRFRIVRFVAKGGMGEIYEAEDLKLGERLAVKTVLASIAANPAAVEQFKREIQLARKVTHPNVCRIYEWVEDPRPSGTIAFLTMELLEGITLSAYLESKGSISVGEAVEFARQMAEGLNAAHRVGVIHQDFKTSNVMLVERGSGQPPRVVITDFGLAQNLRTAIPGGNGAGTPAYMAPEQFEGRTVSAATDVYGFGVVLYEMITGRWPYNARTIEELQSKKLSQAPVVPSKYVPDLPIRVERTILRCLARKPEDRFANTLDVVAALEPPRRKWVSFGGAVLIVAALAGVVGYQWRKAQAMMGEPTVAVVGFRNDSGDAQYDWLATELSESLNTDLGGSKGIHTVPTDEVASVKTEMSVGQNQSLEHEDLSNVRQALGANYLLLGRYAMPQSSDLELDVLLQDAGGRTVSDIHESGSGRDYRKLVADAASQIRDKLGTARLPDTQLNELQNLYPSDPEASQLYFQGLDKLRAFDATTALSFLKKAAEGDPNNLSIHWSLSDAWSQLKHDPEAAQEAQKAAALAEKSSLPQEYVVLAQARAAEANKHWQDAIEDYKSLFRLFPEHLNYGLRLASAQIGGSKPTDALTTLGSLTKLPAPMGSDPRIEMTKAQAYGSMNDFHSELTSAQNALQEAHRRNARMMQARAQLELCWAHRNLGQVDEAYSACTEAQNLFSVFGDNVSAAVALNDLATWLSDRGQYAEAKQLYDRVIEANQKSGAEKDYAGACVNASMVLIHMSKWQDADSYVARALDAAVPIGDKYDEALAHLNRGEIQANEGQLVRAEMEARKAMALADEIQNKAIEVRALSNLAEYQSNSDSERALSTYTRALSVVRESGDKSELSTCLTNMGDLLFRRGDLRGAENKYSEALQIDTELKDNDAIAHDWASFAEVDLERDRLSDAEEKLSRAIPQLREAQDTDSESEAASILVRVLVAEHKVGDADVYVKRMEEISSKNRDTAFDNRLSIGEYLAATGKRTEAIQQIASLPAEAKRMGLNFTSLRARLMLVKLRAGERPRSELTKELASIRSEAVRAGFNILAERARHIQP